MEFDEEFVKGMSAVYKFVYANKPVHRNIIRKQMILKGKISSASKFAKIFDYLKSSGNLTMDGEMVSLNGKNLEVGILQKKGDEYFVVTPNSKKKYKISKSTAMGYNVGAYLDVLIENYGNKSIALILGKSTKKLNRVEKISSVKEKTIENNGDLILGRVVKLSHDELVFIPNQKNFPLRRIPILNKKEEQGNFQDKICVMKLKNKDVPLWGGDIVSVKGEAGNPVHEYDAIAENYGAIMNWDGVALKNELDKIPSSVESSELNLITENEAEYLQKGNVVDLRDLPFATIDPATCKDMDDAIYSTINRDGDLVCYIAVASVTKYVNLDSIIGRRYLKGGFTIYAPNKAYNILPTKLSTGICSLNPNEDRLAFVVKVIIDKDTGKEKSSKIYDAVIKSRCKYSYEEAQQAVDNLIDKINFNYLKEKIDENNELSPEEQLLMNYFVAQNIKKGFEQRKMIKFLSNDEREVVFDEDLKDVVDIKMVQHLLYHEVIENFMIIANEATAKYSKERNLDVIYRVHSKPNTEKTDKANEFFKVLGIDFNGDMSVQGIIDLIELTKGSEMEETINKFLIRMQSRAVYSDTLNPNKNETSDKDLISHYALQSKHYSHTTSPIRRISDYITQYNCLANMHGTKPLSKETIKLAVEIANKRQIEVEQAEKDFDDVSSVLYSEKHIGDVISGKIIKFRYSVPEEECNEEIIAIVKNDERGIVTEIPISQIIGRQSNDCTISEQGCAVLDGSGNIVATLCKPMQFEIVSVDRKTMTIKGKTNKALLKQAELKAIDFRNNRLKKGKENGKIVGEKNFEIEK